MNDPLLKALANALVTFKLQTLFHFSKLDNAFLSHGSEIGPHSLLRAIFYLQHLTRDCADFYFTLIPVPTGYGKRHENKECCVYVEKVTWSKALLQCWWVLWSQLAQQAMANLFTTKCSIWCCSEPFFPLFIYFFNNWSILFLTKISESYVTNTLHRIMSLGLWIIFNNTEDR